MKEVNSVDTVSSECCASQGCPETAVTLCANTTCSPTTGCEPETMLPSAAVCGGPACEESHVKVVNQAQYSAGLKVVEAFNVPGCERTTVIVIPNLTQILIGAYLWNPTYGYFKVVAFDYASSTVTIMNMCHSGNAAPGTVIPACTMFIITVQLPHRCFQLILTVILHF